MSRLDSLRSQIDEIDARLHDLLLQRFEITAEVAKAKGAARDPTKIPRPEREQDILARRLAAHSGDLPTRSLVRIWREIMGAACHQQGDFRIGVAADPFGPLALAARSHFGTAVHLEFGELDILAQALANHRLALLVLAADRAMPTGLYRIGELRSDGAPIGYLASPHKPEGAGGHDQTAL